MRKSSILAPALLSLALFLPAFPAHAVSKEMIQLQTQVQALQDMLGQLQRSNSEQMGVLQHLVEQSNDNLNRMAQQMTSLQAKVEAEGQNTQLSGQIQSLNDSVDELKNRLGKIDATLGNIQSQMQNVNAAPAGGSTAPQDAAPQGAPAGGTSVPLSAPQTNGGNGPGGLASAPAMGPVRGGGAQAPPVEQLYQSAVRDYNGAKYDLSTSEFADVVKFYPDSPMAGNASYYLGEMAYRQGLYPAAIRNYDIVLEHFAGSPKAAAAQLRKGEAEIASSQRDAGVADLRALVQRYPTSPEGAQARSLLNGMGVRISTAAKPSPSRQ
ncbi:tetratricopeptide repeat protein [Acidipila sp. EB88]|uniref:tetratricopeptide repeat protein n=1 Tax=Acidipila sp. EB88 TaxID=2305226 RepID=UPI000F5DBE4B|nr:tetratricopeptide repeat protein [Acidipila sp. EB88]RRA49453.1 outer membrane protein assembly factor BamD [Acidipila sp. EB88]